MYSVSIMFGFLLLLLSLTLLLLVIFPNSMRIDTWAGSEDQSVCIFFLFKKMTEVAGMPAFYKTA